MKKIILLYVGLIIIVVILALVQRGNTDFLTIFKSRATATINKAQFNLLIVKSAEDKEKGLSNRDSLNSKEGMIFLFDTKDTYKFWMRDMRFPIDIIFINDNKIVDIFENVPVPNANISPADLPQYVPREKANYVLEINAGLAKKNNIKIGDTVILKNVR